MSIECLHELHVQQIGVDAKKYTNCTSLTIIFRHLLANLMVPIIQKEIDTFVHVVWNSHRIRAQKNTFLPDGIPNHIYNFPDQYGLKECGISHTVHTHYFQ